MVYSRQLEDNAKCVNANNNNPSTSCIKASSEAVRQTIASECDRVFEEFRKELRMADIDDDDINCCTDLLHKSVREMLNTSRPYEFKGLPVSGFVTFVVMVRSFFRHVVDSKYLRKDGRTDSVKSMLHGFLLVRSLLLHSDQQRLGKTKPSAPDAREGDVTLNPFNNPERLDEDNRPLFTQGIEETAHQLTNIMKARRFQEVLHRDFSSYWLTGSLIKKIISLYKLASSISYKGLLQAPRLLSRNQRAKVFVEFANDANMRIPFDPNTFLDSHVARKIFARRIGRSKPVKCKNFWLPAQGRWIVPENGPGILENRPPLEREKLVRCRLYKHRQKADNPEGLIVFHCHGSGFILTRPEIHDVSNDVARSVNCSCLLWGISNHFVQR